MTDMILKTAIDAWFEASETLDGYVAGLCLQKRTKALYEERARLTGIVVDARATLWRLLVNKYGALCSIVIPWREDKYLAFEPLQNYVALLDLRA